MQRKDELLDQLKSKGLIDDVDKDTLYERMLKIEKEKREKNESKLKSLIKDMKNKGVDFILTKDARTS